MAKKTTPTSDKLKFHSRCAFVRLDKPKPFEDGSEPRWETTFLLDPADAVQLTDIKMVLQQAAAFAKRADCAGFVPLAIKKLAAQFITGQAAPDPLAKDDKIEVAFYHGDEKDYDGFAGKFVIPAHNTIKPAVANRKGEKVEPGEDQFPYSGCYGIGSITMWWQDNKYGKRIGVNLRGVQYDKKGEAFGHGEIAPEDEFEAMEDAEDESAAADAASDFD